MQGDEQGHLWVGAFGDGLYELDSAGKIIKTYPHDAADASSLVSNRIYTLKPDRQGMLWIGTDNGLDRLDLATGN